MPFIKINQYSIPKRGRTFLVTMLFLDTSIKYKTVIIKINAITPTEAEEKANKIIAVWDNFKAAETLQIEDKFTHEIFKSKLLFNN